MCKSRRTIRITRDENGQTLIYVLVAMILGAMVIGPLLAYVSTSLVLSTKTRDNIDAYYAADAGVAWAISELIQPKDEPEDYYGIIGSIAFGGYTVIYTCNDTSDAPEPIPPTYAYLNPFNEDHGADSTNGNLTALAPTQYWLFQVYVPGSEDITIHWAFTAEDSYDCWLYLYEGQQVSWPAGTLIKQDHGVGSAGSAALALSHSVTESGWYTVVFYNSPTDSATINSKPFIGGDSDATWVRVQGYQDYIIESKAKDAVGNVRATVKAYVRQTPGPSKYWLAQQISVFSWQID